MGCVESLSDICNGIIEKSIRMKLRMLFYRYNPLSRNLEFRCSRKYAGIGVHLLLFLSFYEKIDHSANEQAYTNK